MRAGQSAGTGFIGRQNAAIVVVLLIPTAQLLHRSGKPHEYFDPTGSLLAEPNQVLGQLLDLFLAIDLQEPTGLESD